MAAAVSWPQACLRGDSGGIWLLGCRKRWGQKFVGVPSALPFGAEGK